MEHTGPATVRRGGHSRSGSWVGRTVPRTGGATDAECLSGGRIRTATPILGDILASPGPPMQRECCARCGSGHTHGTARLCDRWQSTCCCSHTLGRSSWPLRCVRVQGAGLGARALQRCSANKLVPQCMHVSGLHTDHCSAGQHGCLDRQRYYSRQQFRLALWRISSHTACEMTQHAAVCPCAAATLRPA